MNQTGYDICIHSDSNINSKSCSQFGFIYKHPDYSGDRNLDRALKILAGSRFFNTLEIEVFTKTK